MARRHLAHSIIISAKTQSDEPPLTFLCHEIGDNSVAVKSFKLLEKGTRLQLSFEYWDRVVLAEGSVVELRPYNGAYEGVISYVAL